MLNFAVKLKNTMAKKKVLFISTEMSPYMTEATSAQAEISRRLPQAVQENDNEIRVLMPRFGVINERRNRLHEVVRLSGINITIDDNDNPLTIKVASLQEAKMQVYFLDNEEYFHRKAIYHDENNSLFKDNDERTIFFCKGALETVKKLGWAPDIIHCQGWMTSLIPLYIKTIYKDEPVFKNAKVVYSVFDNDFEETIGKDFARKAGLNGIDAEHMQYYAGAKINDLNIGALAHSDALVRVSEKLDPSVEKGLKKMGGRTTLLHNQEPAMTEEYLKLYEDLMQSN